MNVRKYLSNHQPVVFKTMENAAVNQQFSHAYLLSGESGTPLLPTAMFLAKSLLCDQTINGLSCDECISCRRAEDGNYADLIIVDGQKSSIKKEDIIFIEKRFFEKTSIENKGVMIYIIHLVENMQPESVNALLKFLEEPSLNVYAFLTSENENKVLPTILSRVQILRFKNIDLKILREECCQLGIAEENIDLLLGFYNDAELIKQMSLDENFLSAKSSLALTLEALTNPITALQVIHQSVMPTLKSKESTRYYLDMLAHVFQDMLNLQIDSDTLMLSYGKIIKELSLKLDHIMESFLEIMDVRAKIDLNLNINLLIDHIMIFILKGELSNGRK